MSRNEVLFILKTSNFKFDGRIHKEAYLLKKLGYKVSFYLKSGDDVVPSNYPDYCFYTVKKWGVSKARPLLFQYIADFFFQLQALVFLHTLKGKKILWICDPIMFPLLLLVRMSRFKLVWDHHELPPGFVLKYVLFNKLFSISYKNANLNIHANLERKSYLENKLNTKTSETMVMSNFPVSIEEQEEKPENLAIELDHSIGFIYLQNSFSDLRGVHEIFSALEGKDLYIVCTGEFPASSLESIERHFPRAFSKIIYLGYIKQKNINWLLRRCLCSIVLYKKTSMNQWYCDPNRLYQSVLQNVFIITGSNPTIVSFLESINYQHKIILPNDGCNSLHLSDAIDHVVSHDAKLNDAPTNVTLWDSYENKLGAALMKLTK